MIQLHVWNNPPLQPCLSYCKLDPNSQYDTALSSQHTLISQFGNEKILRHSVHSNATTSIFFTITRSNLRRCRWPGSRIPSSIHSSILDAEEERWPLLLFCEDFNIPIAKVCRYHGLETGLLWVQLNSVQTFFFFDVPGLELLGTVQGYLPISLSLHHICGY